MRTTVDIDDRLLERAKRLALKESKTLSALVDSALAAYLGAGRAVSNEAPFSLLVRGSAQARFPSPAEISAVEEEEDASVVRGARRADP